MIRLRVERGAKLTQHQMATFNDVKSLWSLAAQRGHAKAQYELGMANRFGWGGVPPNSHEATRLLRASGNQRLPEAMLALAQLYEFGANGNVGTNRGRRSRRSWSSDGEGRSQSTDRSASQSTERTDPPGLGDVPLGTSLDGARPRGISRGSRDSRGSGGSRESRESKSSENRGGTDDKNPIEALRWIKKAAAVGSTEALLKLGVIFDEGGLGTHPSARKAAGFLEQAANRGVAEAQRRLGLLYYEGRGLGRDLALATKWLQLASDQGDAEAQHGLACCLEGRKHASWKSALFWYRKAAEQGHVESQRKIGNHLLSGDHTRKNVGEAVNWYRKAAERSDARAQFALGELYEHGANEIVEQSDIEAMRWYRKAADQHLPEAQYAMGCCLEEGRGVRRNNSEAAWWYLLAAKQGLANAQFRLANMTEEGKGAARSVKDAAKWYRKAAEQGMMEAQYALGLLLCGDLDSEKPGGSNLPKDKEEAAKW